MQCITVYAYCEERYMKPIYESHSSDQVLMVSIQGFTGKYKKVSDNVNMAIASLVYKFTFHTYFAHIMCTYIQNLAGEF